MKVTYKTFFFFLFINVITLMAPQRTTAQISINFQFFYDNLSPYGNWVNNPDYGYVWIPNVSSDFTPYSTNGYWIYTNVGWTWVSNYSWGWAPFHYGRWFNDNYYGWIWVPDYEWGPGWVTWRRSQGYYGWAPIGPGISIEIAYSNRYRLPYNYWTFVRNRDFGRRNINNYYVNSSNNITIINNSTVINNIQTDNTRRVRYNAGPDRTEVQKQTGTTITPLTLRERDNPGQKLNKGELQIYRPRVEKNNASGHKPAPAKVMNMKDVKPTFQKSQTQQQRNDQQAKQQQTQQQRNDQQRNDQQVKQQQTQQTQQQRNNQQAKQQQQRNDQQKNKNQPVKRQQTREKE